MQHKILYDKGAGNQQPGNVSVEFQATLQVYCKIVGADGILIIKQTSGYTQNVNCLNHRGYLWWIWKLNSTIGWRRRWYLEWCWEWREEWGRAETTSEKKSILNRNRKLQTSKAPLKSQALGTSLFTSAAWNHRGFPKNNPWEAQVRFPEGERMRQIRGVFQRIVRGKLRSGCQKVRGGRLGVKAGVV